MSLSYFAVLDKNHAIECSSSRLGMAVKKTNKPPPRACRIYGGSCKGYTIVKNVGDISAYMALGAESADYKRSSVRLER